MKTAISPQKLTCTLRHCCLSYVVLLLSTFGLVWELTALPDSRGCLHTASVEWLEEETESNRGEERTDDRPEWRTDAGGGDDDPVARHQPVEAFAFLFEFDCQWLVCLHDASSRRLKYSATLRPSFPRPHLLAVWFLE